jgi:hypothetical protein
MSERNIFDAFEDEFLKFNRIPEEQRRSPRPDVHAFLLLDSIVPPPLNHSGRTSDMVCAAEHDEIFLATDIEALEKNATPAQLCELHRCGVRHDTDTDSLAMFA